MPKTIPTTVARDTACKNMLRRAAGKSPWGSARWMVKYRTVPIASTVIPNAISVAPNGRAYGATAISPFDEPFALAFTETRNSCTSATPADAKERLVRTYARKVRSEARWSRATEPVFCSVSEMLKGSAAAAAVPLSVFWCRGDVDAEGPSGSGSWLASARDCRRRIDRGGSSSTSESESNRLL